MQNQRIPAAIAGLLSCAVLCAQTPPPTSPPPAPSLRIRQAKQETVVDAEGKAVITTTAQVQVLNAAAARVAQFPVPYNATLEDAVIQDAFTLKADGEKIPVDPSAIVTQKATTTDALAPIYSDSEQKIIAFPNVQAGDTLNFTSKLTQKAPYISGQFTTAHYLSSAVEATDTSYSVTVPSSMHLYVSSGGMQQETTSQQGMTTYRWNFSNPSATAQPTALVSTPETRAHFIVSTFPDYDAMAHDYARRIRGKVAATPAVQKQADAITQGITDKKAQARAIYNWVGQNVRYVGIELGSGGIIPHDPDWTLTNRFGDCKDHAVLLASLLKARNISAELVLINAGNRYTLDAVPTLGQFNHMIAWLPDWKQYADTTAPGIPFGFLPIADSGKPVLHALESGAARRQTPVIPVGALNSTYTVHAVQTPQGGFNVDMSVVVTGSWAGDLRRVGEAIQGVGSAAAAGRIMTSHNFANTPGTLQPDAVDGGGESYRISGTAQLGPPGAQGNVLAVTNALALVSRAGDGPMGPLNNRTITESDDTPCYSAHQIEDVTFDFSPGRHLVTVPADVHLKTGNLRYDSQWTVKGDTAVLHREFNADMDQPICTGQIRRDTATALTKIRDANAAPTRLAAATPP